MLLFEPLDIIIIPILLLIIFFLSKKFASRIYDKNLKKVFYLALVFKIICSFIVVIIVNIYKVSDTLNYLDDTKAITNIIIENPFQIYKLLTNTYYDLSPELQNLFPSDYVFQMDTNSGRIATFGFFPYILSLGNYWAINFTFGLFSFFSAWFLFNKLLIIYPSAKKELIFILLFMPSTIYWSSGFAKDPLSQGGLYLFIGSFIEIFYFKNYKLKYIILLLASFRLVLIIKSYIILLLIPFLIFVIIFFLRNDPDLSRKRKLVFNYFLVFIAISILFYLIINPNILGRFAFDIILEEIQMQQEGYSTIEDQGSFIILKEFDGTLLGILKLLPMGFEIAFLRPYLWETNKPLMLISAIENFVIYYFIFNYFKQFNFNIIKIIINASKNKFSFYLFWYSIILGSFIGFTNPNFGTISRYRIPAVTILLISISILKPESSKQKIILKNV